MEQSPENEPVMTNDGSHTLYHPVLKEYYHSLQGSLQESEHIYIDLGLLPRISASNGKPIRIFEMGFGTGLNSLLSWKIADHTKNPVIYTGLEAYPVSSRESTLLNYDRLVQKKGLEVLHSCAWSERLSLSPYFSFKKIEGYLQDYADDGPYDLVYFDAFAPDSQPELWTSGIFARIGRMMADGASLVTYSSKGSVRRALKEAGFSVEKHPGPGRKREVVRAIWK